MKDKDLALRICLLFCLLSFQSLADDELSYSGFGRVILGSVISEKDQLLGYKNALQLQNNSLLGLQLNYQATDALSFTSQFVADSQPAKSTLAWLYLNYQLSDTWQFKLGKLNTPFFHYSDVLDVGFAYSWVLPPDEVYASFFFQYFQGAQAEYTWLADEFDLQISAFAGKVDEDIQVGQSIYHAESDFFSGLIVNASHDNLTIRLSHTRGDYLVAETELTPLIDAFSQAAMLSPVYADIAKQLSVNGDVNFSQLSVSYDLLQFFWQFEWTKIKHNIDILTQANAYYLMAGYHYDKYTFHLTFSERTSEYQSEMKQAPLTSGNPQLDFIAQQYNVLSNQRPVSNARSLTLGVRYDVNYQVALKADIRLTQGQPNIGLPTMENTFDGSATLLLGGIEWVF